MPTLLLLLLGNLLSDSMSWIADEMQTSLLTASNQLVALLQYSNELIIRPALDPSLAFSRFKWKGRRRNP